jgi:hypothetical protein
VENNMWRPIFRKLVRSYLEIESVSDVLYNWKHVTSER